MIELLDEEIVGMPASDLAPPPEDDQMTPREAVAEFGIELPRLTGWWVRGAIPYWKRGRSVILSRAATSAYLRKMDTLRPGQPRRTVKPE